ncbi:OmpH family outer membrane protein [Candidatus Pelagibacter sp.]|jgi:Skp family chaperone for outer membrane proteins|nr:OmpH family outer membrane protein [Candidatus Pelagibacter sp.]
MKNIALFLVLFVFGFNTLLSANNIVYMDMNKVMTTSKPGLNLMLQFDELEKKNIKDYNETIKKLKDIDQKILAQKNIISKTEFQKKIEELKKEIFDHNEQYKLKIDKLNKKKIKYTNELLQLINPILIKFSDEKKISMIFKKKDLIIGKSNLDITDEIIKLINEQIKEIEVK